jgi:hypothetical protein
MLRLAEDPFGQKLWPTVAERERAEKERERAEKERERAEKERERAEKERVADGAARVVLRGLSRRLGRPLADVERDAVLDALRTTAVDALDDTLAALDDAALVAWLVRR